MSTQITCPKCGHLFSLDEAQKHEMEEMRLELQKKLQTEIESEMKKKAFGWAQEEIKKAKFEAEEASKKHIIELDMLRKQKEESDKKEAEFYKQKLEFDQLKGNLELEKDKARIEERKKLEEEYNKQLREKMTLELEKERLEADKRLRAKDEQIAQMQRSIEDAKRKGEQGSMQIQGELLEDALKELLQTNFPYDLISDVEKGIKGADLVQEVRNEWGQSVGIIAWESKNTKAWSDLWVDKMKEDRLRVGASVSIIVSSVLPEGMKHFGIYRDIWVTDYESVLALTMALRSHMSELSKVRNSLKGKDEKMEVIYNYLISPEFKAKIENIIDAFRMMKDQLEQEKRAMEKQWAMREKLLERVIGNTDKMHGELQGFIGSALPKIDYLELGGGE